MSIHRLIVLNVLLASLFIAQVALAMPPTRESNTNIEFFPTGNGFEVAGLTGAENPRAVCEDTSGSGGCLLSYFPTGSLVSAVTQFIYRIDSDIISGNGASDFDQQVILSPPGTNLTLEWSAFIGQLGVRIFANGMESQSFVPNFLWEFDTDYFVQIETDATTDRYRILIDDMVLVDELLAVDTDFTSTDRVSFRSGFVTQGSFEVDDVEMAPLLGGASILLDTFDDDKLDSPPNGPEIGIYFQSPLGMTVKLPDIPMIPDPDVLPIQQDEVPNPDGEFEIEDSEGAVVATASGDLASAAGVDSEGENQFFTFKSEAGTQKDADFFLVGRILIPESAGSFDVRGLTVGASLRATSSPPPQILAAQRSGQADPMFQFVLTDENGDRVATRRRNFRTATFETVAFPTSEFDQAVDGTASIDMETVTDVSFGFSSDFGGELPAFRFDIDNVVVPEPNAATLAWFALTTLLGLERRASRRQD